MSEERPVLVVCQANRCRSPMMEALLRAALDEVHCRWQVRSAGTRAVEGLEMDSSTRRVLERRHLLVGPWRTRRVTPEMLHEAGLVLAADSSIRSALVAMAPERRDQTFTLLQFARLTRHIPQRNDLADSLSAYVASALAVRPIVQPAAPGSDDLDDPNGHRQRAFRRCELTIDGAVRDLVRPLTAGAHLMGPAADH